MAINPAKYLSVLKKASDQQLFQMLQRPDQIPTMFVQQEIARRNRSRVSAKAQLNQMANQMANSQKPMLPVTQAPPQDQSLYAQTGGDGITRMKPGGRVTPKGNRRRVGGGTDGTGMPRASEIYAFMAESGRAIGKLDDTKEANLMAWLTNKKNKPFNLGDVEKVINWLDQGIIQPKAGNAKKIRAFANEILNENNYDPRESGGSLYKGFVRENVPPLFEKGLNLIKKLGAGAEKVIFGEDGFEGYKKDIKEYLQKQSGNVFNEENPPPPNPVDQALSESGAMKAQEFKRLEEADQPTPQDLNNIFLPFQEEQRKEANRLAMVDAQRNQGLADYYADKEARRMAGFEKAQNMKALDNREDKRLGMLANEQQKLEGIESQRLRDVESQRLTAMANDPLQTVIMDGNRVARLPDQNPDLRRAEIAELQNRAMGFSPQFPNPEDKFREREIAQNKAMWGNDPSTNVGNVPSNYDKILSNVKDFGNIIKGQIPDFKTTFSKGIDFLRDPSINKINQDLVNEVSSFGIPFKRENPTEKIGGKNEEFIISPEENEPYIPPREMTNIQKGLQGAYKTRLEREIRGKQKQIDRYKRAEIKTDKELNDLFTTNYGDTSFRGDQDETDKRTSLLFGRKKEINEMIPKWEDDIIVAKNLLYANEQLGPDSWNFKNRMKRGIDTLYDKHGRFKLAIDTYDPEKVAKYEEKTGKNWNANRRRLGSYDTELARIAEGQAFGQNYKTGPTTAEEYENYVNMSKIGADNKINETTSPLLNTARDVSNYIGKGIEYLDDQRKYGSDKLGQLLAGKDGNVSTWREEERNMFIPDSINNENQLKYEEASGTGTFGSDKDQSSQKKWRDNTRSLVDPVYTNKVIEETMGSGSGKGDGNTSNTGIGGVASQQLSDLTKAQDKLLEAMKPQKDAYSRFWGLVADFGANIAASDKVGFINAAGEAMRSTMDSLQGINKEDRDKFIESAKLAVEFEADKRDFALKIANANASAGRSNKAHELALKRLGLDMKEYELSKLNSRSKALTDQLKNLNPADLNYDEQTANINSAINENNRQILLLDNELVYEDGQLTST